MSEEAGVYRVLLVDDEANVLNALRRCLSFINIDMLGGEGIRWKPTARPSWRSNGWSRRTSIW